MTRASFKIDGAECPECGSVKTRSRRGGFTQSGLRIRHRYCEECEEFFNTFEIAAEFVFGRMDDSAREKNRRHRLTKESRTLRIPPKRNPRVAAAPLDNLRVWTSEEVKDFLESLHIQNSETRRRLTKFFGRMAAFVTLEPGKVLKFRWCAKGLHDMTPENTYVQPTSGHRKCQQCRRDWRNKNRDKVNAQRRERAAQQRRRLQFERLEQEQAAA